MYVYGTNLKAGLHLITFNLVERSQFDKNLTFP